MPNPVAHETLRARMAALHGREDALLETGRFAKLLRQANDAEVADVRKTGDDTYEVSVHPTDIVVPRQRPAAKPSPAVNAVAAPTPNGDRAAPVADVVSVVPTPVRQYASGAARASERTNQRSQWWAWFPSMTITAGP